jgi:hypothetical protein
MSPVDLYRFFSWCLVLIAVITLLWPANILLMALAYKVRQGNRPIEMEPSEFWWRCALAALGLAGFSLVLLGLNYGLVSAAGVPMGPVQLTLFLFYVPAAIGFLYWMLALDDLLQGSGVFSLYILLPLLPILLLGRFGHWWEKLQQAAPWLLATS